VTAVDAVAVVLWVGVTLYVVFGGADFGTGFWDLAAGGAARGERPRGLIDHAIGPVWEANHVWLIFCLVVLWTGFPRAFAAVMSTLYVPLSLAALGIVLRGAGFAFRKATMGAAARGAYGAVFAISSILTPFFLGAALGGIASARVPARRVGNLVTSWVNPTSLFVGILAVAICAYLAAVFLAIDARRLGQANLERYFLRRALAAAVVAGAAAIAGFFVLRADAPDLYRGLAGKALPLVAVSVACGVTVLFLLARGARMGTRLLAVGAVATMVWAWGVAQYPYLLPETLTVAGGAAVAPTLRAILIVFVAALVVVGPSLALLFVLDQRSRLDAA
jgi:cytochrome bd ubiquinol oxidase subunit II